MLKTIFSANELEEEPKEESFTVFGKELSKQEFIDFVDANSTDTDEYFTIDEALKESKKWESSTK